MTSLSFRPYLPKDAETLAALFTASIMVLVPEEYSPEQCAAWASAAEDVPAFGKSLEAMLTILVEAKTLMKTEGDILGFAALKDKNRLEMLYVAPDHAGQGIGKALLGVMEMLASKRGAEAMLVDASEVARDFFQHLGYEMQARNTVMRGEEWLVNTSMKKTLVPISVKPDA